MNLPRGFNISKDEKFRNQQVLLVIDVPVGKKIEIDRSIYDYSGFNLDLGDGYNDWDWNDDWRNNYSWNSNVEYIMTNDGLKPTHPIEEKNEEEENLNEPSQPAGPTETNPDSSHYHYKPLKDSQSTNADHTEVSINSGKPIKTSVKITDITFAFLERFSL